MDVRRLHVRSPLRYALGVVVTLVVPTAGRAAGALDALASAGAKVGPVLGSTVVIAAPVTSDEPGTTDELGVHLAALVAAQLGPDVTASPQASELATARVAGSEAKTIVFVRTRIDHGDIQAAVEVYRAVVNVWDRIRHPANAPSRRVAVTEKIDAQVRAFLAPLALGQARVERFRLEDDDDVLAAACGDIAGDGRDELALVSRRKVAIGHLQEGAFAVEHTTPWRDLLPRASVPLRDPLGGAVATTGRLLVGSTDYGGVALAPDLSKLDRLAGIPVWGARAPLCLIPQPSAGAFDGAPVDCAPSRDPRPALVVPAPRFDALAATAVVDAKGQARILVVAHEPRGQLRLRLGEESGAVQGRFGAEIAVGDIDQDGFPEVVTTAGGGSIDVVTIVGASAAPQARLHLPTPDPVRALAICPPGEQGAPAIAAVVGRQIWLVHPERGTRSKGSR